MLETMGHTKSTVLLRNPLADSSRLFFLSSRKPRWSTRSRSKLWLQSDRFGLLRGTRRETLWRPYISKKPILGKHRLPGLTWPRRSSSWTKVYGRYCANPAAKSSCISQYKWTMELWGHSPDSGCNTQSIAGQPRVASVTAPASPLTRRVHSRVG